MVIPAKAKFVLGGYRAGKIEKYHYRHRPRRFAKQSEAAGTPVSPDAPLRPYWDKAFAWHAQARGALFLGRTVL